MTDSAPTGERFDSMAAVSLFIPEGDGAAGLHSSRPRALVVAERRQLDGEISGISVKTRPYGAATVPQMDKNEVRNG